MRGAVVFCWVFIMALASNAYGKSRDFKSSAQEIFSAVGSGVFEGFEGEEETFSALKKVSPESQISACQVELKELSSGHWKVVISVRGASGEMFSRSFDTSQTIRVERLKSVSRLQSEYVMAFYLNQQRISGGLIDNGPYLKVFWSEAKSKKPAVRLSIGPRLRGESVQTLTCVI